MTATRRVLVATVASASSPDRSYEIRTDGETLSCNCPGWTRRTHEPTCPALTDRSCTCNPASTTRTARTCRHVREVLPRVTAMGGLALVRNLLLRGVTLDVQQAVALDQPNPRLMALAAAEAARARTTRARSGPCTMDCAERFEQRALRCLHGRSLAEAFRSLLDRPEATPSPLPPMPDWLGGGRAIILRD